MLVTKECRIGNIRRILSPSLALLLFGGLAAWGWTAQATPDEEKIVITSSFTGREIAPTEKIELKLSRALTFSGSCHTVA